MKELLSCYSERLEQATDENAPNLSQEDEAFLQRIEDFVKHHTMRYANVDWLYWYEFQNRVSIVLQKFVLYLDQDGEKDELLERIDHIYQIAAVLYDMTGCEKCTNIGYFALLEDLILVLTKIFKSKFIATEKVMTAILDVIDAVFLLSANQKAPMKFGFKQDYINEIGAVAKQFVNSITRII